MPLMASRMRRLSMAAGQHQYINGAPASRAINRRRINMRGENQNIICEKRRQALSRAQAPTLWRNMHHAALEVNGAHRQA